MEKLIYISGKMGERHLSNKTKLKFQAAAMKMGSQGWTVVNPASPSFQQSIEEMVEEERRRFKKMGRGKFDWYSLVLLYDMREIAFCDAIYMLRDWKDSPGATAEHEYAKACRKQIIYETDNIQGL